MKFTLSDAKYIVDKYNVDTSIVSIQTLKIALNIELEHGSEISSLTNITKDDLDKTAKIVFAHLMEFPDYYDRLIDLESEAKQFWKGKVKPSIFIGK